MRISDWSSDVCSSDLHFSSGQRNDRECKEADKVVGISHCTFRTEGQPREKQRRSKDPRQCEIPWKIDTTRPHVAKRLAWPSIELVHPLTALPLRSEEHTSELQSLMRTSYAVFCLKKKKNHHEQQ